MKKNIKLPEKQSALLRLAVKDAQVIEKNKNYKFNMGKWHYPEYNFKTNKNDGKCSVCMAGAIIANTFKVSSKKQFSPFDFEDIDTTIKLQKVDELRSGHISYSGKDEDRITAVETASSLISINFLDSKGRASWKFYLKAAEILESVGL